MLRLGEFAEIPQLIKVHRSSTPLVRYCRPIAGNPSAKTMAACLLVQHPTGSPLQQAAQQSSSTFN